MFWPVVNGVAFSTDQTVPVNHPVLIHVAFSTDQTVPVSHPVLNDVAFSTDQKQRVQFGLISLHNVVHEILSNILVNWLKPVLLSLESFQRSNLHLPKVELFFTI
jgi:hypothetical protein